MEQAMNLQDMLDTYGENMTAKEVALFFKCLKESGDPAYKTIYAWHRDERHPLRGFSISGGKLLFLTTHVFDVWMQARRGEID